MSQAPVDSMVGRALGDFVIRERIGQGGSGEVFRAEQVSLGREAVIKVLERTREMTAEANDRFLREARLASRLEHPFAAHVYAFGSEPDGMLWIAMELVRGTSLDRLIKTQGPVPLARFVPFLERLAEVLQAAHDQGIVHRDIKPANVMAISHSGRLLPKLLDLGIARVQGTAPPAGEGAPRSEPSKSDVEFMLAGGLTPHLVGESINTPNLSTPPNAASDFNETKTDPKLQSLLSRRMLLSEELELTGVGAVVGTPHFMAPEQWVDPSRAGPLSDQYSLAILAYEVITGRLPFQSKTIRAMAKEHARTPLPPLGSGLPDALHATLSRGAAKKPEHRFKSVLEFAAAVRAASGVGVEPVSLPGLDERLRETIISQAPQPIADAVALLDGARTAKQAVEAVGSVRRVLFHYVGVLALASRARIGAAGPGDSLEVARLTQKLATSSLEPFEWVLLAKELCRPLATMPEAHVLPELVSLFFTRAAQSTDASGLLAELGALSSPSPLDPEDVQLAFLHRATSLLSRALSATSFIFDYPLVVRRGDAERWVGARRVRRLPAEVIDSSGTEGDVVLISSAGTVVVALSPLLQVIAPSVGAPEELFFLEGAGRFGARLVAVPSPFERQDPELWSWFSKHIGNVGDSLIDKSKAEVEPYKGLSTFTTQDADNYFGREREAQDFANRLRTERLLAVVGPSGAGKSSFILAGVLPLLPKGFRPLVVRPGATPTASVLAKLAAEGLASRGDNPLDVELPEGQTLVLVVDQFEELVTLCADPAERQRFAKLLTEACEKNRSLRVLLTLRDDFLIKIQQLEAFRERMSGVLQLLGTPAANDLVRVVTEPARRVGFGFDDDTLPHRMVEAVAEYPGALALLSFTASQLWKLRDRHLQQMRAKTYEALGGVGGALANHAEATLAQLPPAEQKLVREAFRQLVTGQGTRAVLSRKEVLETLGNDAAAESVLGALVNARLLVTSENAAGEDQVELIHEALIVSWPRLVGWLREDAETARLRDALRASARQWDERGQPKGLLWRAETLTEYKIWRARFPGHLTTTEAAFATASLADERRGQLIRRALAGVAVASLLVGLVVIFRAYQRAEANAVEAQRRVAGLRQEQGRQAMLNDKPLEALAYLTAAKEAGASGHVVEHMLKTATWLTRGELLRLENFGTPTSAALSPNGKRLALLVKNVTRVFDVASGDIVASIKENAQSVAFLNDGALVLGLGSRVVFYSLEQGATMTTWQLDGGNAFATTSAAKGELIAVSMYGNASRVVRPDGGVVAMFDHDTGTMLSTMFVSPKGTHAVEVAGNFDTATSLSQSARFIDLSSGALLFELTKLPEPANLVSFSGDRAAVTFADGRLGVWQLTGVPRGSRPNPMWALTAHRGRILNLATSPDGKTLFTLGSDGTLRFFDVATGNPGPSVTLSAGGLSLGAWSSDGASVFVAAPEGTIHRVVARTGERLWHSPGLEPLLNLWLTSGGTLVTVSATGTTRVLDANVTSGRTELAGEEALAILGGPTSPVQPVLTKTGWLGLGRDGQRIPIAVPLTKNTAEGWVDISADGQRLVGLQDGKLEVFRLRDAGYELEQELVHNPPFSFFSLSGDGSALASQDADLGLTIYRGAPFTQALILPNDGAGRAPSVFSADGGEMFVTTIEGAFELWETNGPRRLAKKVVDTAYVPLTATLEPDELLAISPLGRVEVWRQSDFTKLATISTGGVVPLNACPHLESQLIDVWLPNGAWETWDLKTNAPISRVTVLGPLAAAGVSPSGALVAGASGTLLRTPLGTPVVTDADIARAERCGTPFVLENDRLERRPTDAACVTQRGTPSR